MGIDNLKPFKEGHDDRRNLAGRPKSVYTTMRLSGYSKDDIKLAFEEIGWQSLETIQKIIDEKTEPVLILATAEAFKRAATKGDFRYISEILQHVMGKPKEQTENKHLHKILVEYVSPKDRSISSTSGAGGDSEGS